MTSFSWQNVPLRGSYSQENTCRGRLYEVPKLRLPIFSGKTEWEPFWIQFQLMTTRFEWDRDEQGEQLLLCLKDEALTFAAHLSSEVRCNTLLFVRALQQRFGDHVMPETHRMNLQNIKQMNRETIQEYVSRVSTAMPRAYPGLDNNSKLYTELSIEHLLNGLQDQSLAYDVMTKRPPTLDAALDMLMWHECCKIGIRKKTAVRQVATDYNREAADYVNDDMNVRRVNSHGLVTGEQFGKKLIEDVSTAVTSQLQTSLMKNLEEFSTAMTEQLETFLSENE
jgi:hypothetical protein